MPAELNGRPCHEKQAQIGDRIVPMRLTVLPLEKPDEQTILHYRKLVFDLPIDETYFSLRNLKKP